MRRRLTIATVLVGLVLVLAACTPPLIGTVGIERDADGSLNLLVRLCRGSIDTLIVHGVDSFPSGTGEALVSEDETTEEPVLEDWMLVPDIETTLNPALTGGADIPFPSDVTDLDPAVLYELWAAGREGNAFSGLFSASELAELVPGEVMAQRVHDDAAPEDPGGSYTVVTRDKFERRASLFCS